MSICASTCVVFRSLDALVKNNLGRIVAPDGTPAIKVISEVAAYIFQRIIGYYASEVYADNGDQCFDKGLEQWVQEGASGEMRTIAKHRIIEAYTQQAEDLDLTSLHLKSLPDFLGSLMNLEELNLSDNRLASIPDSVSNITPLKRLDLSCNGFDRVPEIVFSLTGLTALELGGSRFRTLSDRIERLTHLKVLNLSDVHGLTSLPESLGNLSELEILTLSSSGVTSLPESLGNLRRLQYLGAEDCRLTTLPESFGNLSRLTYANFSRNPLRSLPGNIFRLPPNCQVSLSACRFSDQILDRLQEVTRTRGYAGPRIRFDMASLELENSCFSLDNYLKRFLKISGRTSVDLSFITNLSIYEKGQMQMWLSRLSGVANFRREGETEKRFAQRILSYIEFASKDEGFRDVLLGIVDGASKTCGDRVILSVLHIDLAYQLATMDKSNPQKVADFLKRGPGALRILEEIARNKVPTLGMVDEIEVYLAYPIQLKEVLGLPINTDKMLHFKVSGVTAQDLEQARQKVQTFFDDKNALLRFLVGQEIWVDILKKTFPEQHEALNKLRFERSEDPEESKNAQQCYIGELIERSRSLLV